MIVQPGTLARKERHPMLVTLILVALALYLGAIVLPVLLAGLLERDE